MTATACPITIRCSSLPMAYACPASIVPDIKIKKEHSWTRGGNAGHAVAEKIVKNDLDDIPEINAIATKYDVEEDELRQTAYSVLGAWKLLRDEVKMISVEEPLKCSYLDVELTGHPDFIGKGINGELVVLDWKTGYLEGDYTAQLVGYAILAHSKYSEMKFTKVKVITVFTQSKTIDQKTMAWEEIYGLADLMLNKIKKQQDVYNPGEACKYCPRKFSCEAKAKMINNFGIALIEKHELIGDTDIGKLYDRCKLLTDELKDFKDFLKSHIISNGDIEAQDGRIFTTVRTKKQAVDYEIAFDYIADNFTYAERLTFIKVSKTDLLKAVMDRAAYRMKGADAKRVMEELKSIEAVKISYSEKLTVRKGDKYK